MGSCHCSDDCQATTKSYFATGHDAKFASKHSEVGETAFKAASRLKVEYGNLEKAKDALEGKDG